MRDCLLPSLVDNSSCFPFIGLDKSEEHIALNPSYFPCCDGRGLQLFANGDAKHCLLLARYHRLQTILELFLRRWGTDHRQALHQMIKKEDLELLRKIFDNTANTGRMLVSEGRANPSYLWIVAITAVWRFGFTVHFVTLSLRKELKVQLLPNEYRGQLLVLVENLCSPWQPENRADCETIINYCYETMTPLWLDFVKDNSPQTFKRTTAVNQLLQEELARLYDREPHLYLSKRGQSKLAEVIQ